MANRERVEAAYGCDELWKATGPGHEEAWQYGYISGKLAPLRWVPGSEWDFLDTWPARSRSSSNATAGNGTPASSSVTPAGPGPRP